MSVLNTDRRVAVIKALAHPARLRIAEALASGERCVTELQALVGGDLSTVSKHLTLMREAGWVACEKHGQHVHYRLACDCLATFLHCIDSLAGDDSNCC
ncbi:ArsR/SmtB family transcription factor [Haloferula sp. A504]|uniref:ArsR/SmtB family transcription factor n=1 Tax=Haloferula sp. A504 TaxID=3373601 RepID=UPI0031C9513B|nr:metalloregulator ArsR/SmtB family transcription factor [Verrucomicrobiaceae bacterium E54]